MHNPIYSCGACNTEGRKRGLALLSGLCIFGTIECQQLLAGPAFTTAAASWCRMARVVSSTSGRVTDHSLIQSVDHVMSVDMGVHGIAFVLVSFFAMVDYASRVCRKVGSTSVQAKNMARSLITRSRSLRAAQTMTITCSRCAGLAILKRRSQKARAQKCGRLLGHIGQGGVRKSSALRSSTAFLGKLVRAGVIGVGGVMASNGGTSSPLKSSLFLLK